MRTTTTTENIGGAFGAPGSGDSLTEILRALSVLVGRQQMRQWLQRVAIEAGSDLPLADCWVLVQLRRNPAADLPALAAAQKIPPPTLHGAVAELIDRGLLTTPDAETGSVETPLTSLSPSGEVVADQLIDAVRTRLEGLLDGWSPEHYPELVHVLGQFASDIVPGTPAMSGAGAGPDSIGPGL